MMFNYVAITSSARAITGQFEVEEIKDDGKKFSTTVINEAMRIYKREKNDMFSTLTGKDKIKEFFYGSTEFGLGRLLNVK